MTSFLDFQPFLRGFQSVNEYLKDLTRDINNPIKVFHAIYEKFLTAINHIDYHPSQVQNTTRVKRSEEYNLCGHYHTHI